jgi:YVTN family beta-propeller protein
MVMKSHRFWIRQALVALGVLTMAVSALPIAGATDLPAGVLSYLRQKDPKVKVRFDGLVLFSNGQSYVPVIPQDPSLNADSQQVIATLPEKDPYPDLIQFDNNFFLMRLVQTSSGRLTFPKMSEYPLQLKEGLLPQDFVMPKNLFIPVELKVILGALPYNPSYTPTNTPALSPVLAGFSPEQLRTATRQTYVFDLNQQKVIAIDPNTGAKIGEVALDCSPSGLQMSPDGTLLFVPCLSSNELAVVDTGSNLVKTRVPVGQRPDAVLFVHPTHDVVISNRYSSFLSVINSEELVSGHEIELPGNGGAMAQIPGEKVPKLIVAEAFKPELYLVNLSTGAIEKTIPALPEISALKLLQTDKGGLEIWAVSRTKDQVMVVDLFGKVLKTLNVGNKPVDLAVYEDKVLVLSAGDSKVTVIDRASKSSISTITLQADGFPSGMVVVPSDKVAYITMAGSNSLVRLNPESGSVENTLPVNYRASMISMTPGKEEVAKFAAADGAPSATKSIPAPASDNANAAVGTPNKKKQEKTEVGRKTPQKSPQNNSKASDSSPSVSGQPDGKSNDGKNAAVNHATPSSSAQSAGRAQSPMSTGGKFRLDLHVGKKAKDKPEPQQSAQQEAKKQPDKAQVPASTSSTPAPQSPVTSKGSQIPQKNAVQQDVPKAQSKVTAQSKLEKQASSKKGKKENKEESVLPAKPGARLEQKPLVMPLDLPSESTLPDAASTSTTSPSSAGAAAQKVK